MYDKSLEILLKQLTGEEVTKEEAAYQRDRHTKYELVRYVYFEKAKSIDPALQDFHFTPSESFMEVPIYDMVESLLKIDEAVNRGEYKPLDFEDLGWYHNPPETGVEKTTI